MTSPTVTRAISTIGLVLNTVGAALLIVFPLGNVGSYANGLVTSYSFHDNVGAYFAILILAAGFPIQIWALWRE